MKASEKKRPVNRLLLGSGLFYLVLACINLFVLSGEATYKWVLGMAGIATGIWQMVTAFRGGPKEEPIDPRPLQERWREQMQSYSPEQLHSIIDDRLRSNEIRELAREILEERQRGGDTARCAKPE